MALVANALATVGNLVAAVMNYFTDMFLTPPLKATIKHLEETELKTLQGGKTHSKSNWWIHLASVLCLICCATFLPRLVRNEDPESEISVGEVWSCRHGSEETWMIFVQRGDVHTHNP